VYLKSTVACRCEQSLGAPGVLQSAADSFRDGDPYRIGGHPSLPQVFESELRDVFFGDEDEALKRTDWLLALTPEELRTIPRGARPRPTIRLR
jgi:hypothetical protein